MDGFQYFFYMSEEEMYHIDGSNPTTRYHLKGGELNTMIRVVLRPGAGRLDIFDFYPGSHKEPEKSHRDSWIFGREYPITKH